MKESSIAIFALICDSNIGDKILAESGKWLCEKTAENKKFVLLDLKGRDAKLTPFVFSLKAIRFFIRKFASIFLRKNIGPFFIDSILFDLYLKKLGFIEEIFFGGGGIVEYKHYDCDFYIKKIINFAQIKNIPVHFLAVGFNGNFEINDKRCEEVVKLINSDTVKTVSVRENFDEAKNKWFYKKNVELVCDPAVWSSEAYSINQKKSALIGVGVIRPKIFSEFKNPVSRKDILNFYLYLLKELDRRNLKWEIFTNGSKSDFEFGKEILKTYDGSKYKDSKKYIKDCENSGKKFLENISAYKKVVCARMHASICSYSLKIPSMAIYWNPKQEFFYDSIGGKEFLIKLNDNDWKSKLNEFLDMECDSYHPIADKSEYISFKNTIKVHLSRVLQARKHGGGRLYSKN